MLSRQFHQEPTLLTVVNHGHEISLCVFAGTSSQLYSLFNGTERWIYGLLDNLLASCDNETSTYQ